MNSGLPRETEQVVRDEISQKVARLRRATATSTGIRLERVRWLLAKGRRSEARAALNALAGSGRNVSPDARELGHRIVSKMRSTLRQPQMATRQRSTR
jgi:hypothetical protein